MGPTWHRTFPLGLLVGVFCGCNAALPAIEPRAMEPASGAEGDAVAVTILGDGFVARSRVNYDDPAASLVDARFAARLGATDLRDVSLLDARRLRATVPGTLAAGTYALSVTDPYGRTGVLAGAFTVTPRPIARIAIETAPDGAGVEVADAIVRAGQSLALYAVGYGAGGPVGAVDVSWSASDPRVALAPSRGTSTVLASSVPSSVIVTAVAMTLGLTDQTGTIAFVACASDADCDDGSPCSGVETCLAGACVPGTPSDGAPCDDGLFCTDPDVCAAGACAGGSRDCSAAAGTCTAASCDETLDACVSIPAADGTPCDDGAFCSDPDFCAAGLCTSGPRDCSLVAGACSAGTCDETAGACVAVAVADGTPCGDGIGCNDPDVCTAGVCGGTASCGAFGCSDGVDNDGDSAIDFPADPGCTGATDPDESNTVPPESCLAETALAVPPTGVVTGTTVGAGSSYAGSCGGGTSADVVVEIVLTANVAGLVAASDGPGSNYDTLIYARDACDDPASQLACDDDFGIGQQSMFRTGPLAPGRYFVFFDGAASQGTYDGTIQALVGAGGGCSPTAGFYRCAPELACVASTGGQPVCQPAGCAVIATYTTSFRVGGTTAGLPNHHAGSCGEGRDGGARAPEAVYGLWLAAPVTNVRASTQNPGTDFDTLIYMRLGCSDTEVGCDDDSAARTRSVFDTGPLPAGDYYLFVDGFGWWSGNYDLSVDVTP